MSALLLYLFLGSFAGILAGLLGVGGGIVIVPMLTFAFTIQHFPDAHMHHVALGTSLATIMFTSVASLRAHHAHGAVNWQVVRQITPGIFIGTIIGSWVVAQLGATFLKAFFVVFLFYVALQMILDIRPKTTRQLPNKWAVSGVGTFIGGISSMVGIGGGTLSTPFLIWCNFPFRSAIGTSAAIGFPIALSGTIGYIINGWNVQNLPPNCVGFINLPALAGVAVASFITAPFGARLAHTLPVPRLKKIFAFLLIATGTKMLITLL